MEPKNEYRSGPLKIEYGDGVTNPVYQDNVKFRDSVTRTTSEGDKKSPTAHSYQTTEITTWSGTRTVIDSKTGAMVRVESGVQPGETSLHTDIIVPGHDISSYETRLYNRALANLNSQIRGNLDLSISAAEFRSTAKMFGSIGKLSSYVKRGGTWSKTALGTAGKNWLGYSLGWRPLVQDIYGSVDEFYRSTMPKLLEFTGKASERLTNASVASAAGWPKQSATRSGIAGVHIHVRYRTPGFDIARWTSLNPLSIAWELMPYSFVVDYFYNIGNLLRGVETAVRYDPYFESGYITKLFAEDAYCVDNRRRTASGSTEIRDLVSSYKIRNFQRIPLGSYPLPRLPQLEVPSAATQLLTLASLLSQKLR